MMFTRNIRSNIAVLVLFLAGNLFGYNKLCSDSLPDYEYLTLGTLREQLDKTFTDSLFNGVSWSISVQSLLTGEIVYTKDDNRTLIPASNLKLFTTAAALLSLGPEYRFKTEIYTRGKVDGSILKGDLIVRGFGDPSISPFFYNENVTAVYKKWADSLLERGIDEIKGNIIGDDNAFDDVRFGQGWEWDYESYWYSAPAGALSFNDNCVDISITPGNLNELALFKTYPQSGYVTIMNNVITVSKDSITDIKIYRQSGTNIINLYGTIKANDNARKVIASINNPTQFAIVTLKEVLESKGIKVTGYAADIDDISDAVYYDKATLLFTHQSPTLAEIIKVINKNSHNLFAEQLLKTLGYEYYKYGSAENGIKAVRTILSGFGIETDKIQMVDGSGLSRQNMASSAVITQLLGKVYNSDVFPFFYNSLPVAGKDGTLATRMRKTRAIGNVRGKSGFLTGARSLSGYLFTGDKELICYSIIANNFLIPRILIENAQDFVCTKLASFRRK